ncbi:MAG TPA: hypothetical protein VIC30_07290 [Orrella sp.]
MSEAVMETENTESTSENTGLLSPEIQSNDAPEEQAMPHMAEVEETPIANDNEIDWGDRPDWMPENFWDEKDGPDLEGIAQAYQELRTKMSQGKHKAPKDGKYDISSLKDHGVPEDDALLGQFSKFAAENGLSQEQFEQIADMYVNNVGELFEKVNFDREQELQKLGPKGDKVVAGLNSWLGKLANSGTLSQEEVDAVASAATNANYIKALNKIRASYGEQTIPDVGIQEGKATTRADLDAMVGDERYGKDMHYTQQVERKFMEFFGE